MNIFGKTLFLLIVCLFISADSARNPTTPSPRRALKLACGTIMQYDLKDPSIVAELGISGGQYADGSEAYVGVGNNYKCRNEFNCPGRISVTGGSQGVYMSCENAVLDTIATRFVVEHPDLRWIRTNGAQLENGIFSDLVSIRSGKNTFYFGRTNFTKPDGSTYTVVSKVLPTGVMIYTLGNGISEASDIEVLSC